MATNITTFNLCRKNYVKKTFVQRNFNKNKYLVVFIFYLIMLIERYNDVLNTKNLLFILLFTLFVFRHLI